ncbi:MAG: aldo/keto reductase [Anaerolineales bacterium]|nr:aldo/keto reductase [Anaerolineales bacterium]
MALSEQAALPRRRLGRTGLELSIIGAGGWIGLQYDALARTGWGGVTSDEGLKQATAVAAVRRALELGINYFDTAPMYSHGEAERVLGKGLRALRPAEQAQVHVSTKVGWHPERICQYDAGSIHWSLEQSFRKLGRDRLDIVFIHDPKTDAHMEQILGPGGAVEALEGLQRQGVIRAIGLGVRTFRFLRRAIDSGRFDAILPSYDHTPVRASLAGLMDYAFARGVGVVYGSPYLAGLLAGLDPDEAARRRPTDSPADLARARALWRWANDRRLDLGAIAMQYSLRNAHIGVVLAGPRNAAELSANVRHATTPLPAGIWEELEAFTATLPPAGPGGEVDPPNVAG